LPPSPDDLFAAPATPATPPREPKPAIEAAPKPDDSEE
jgi:hypothetical protein